MRTRTLTKIIQPALLPLLPSHYPKSIIDTTYAIKARAAPRKEVTPSNKAVLQTTNNQAMLCHAYANAQMERGNMLKGTIAAAAFAWTAVEK